MKDCRSIINFGFCLAIVNILMISALLYNLNEGFTLYQDFDEKRGESVGMYVRDSYYCVLTDGMDEDEITEIKLHEICHHAVFLDKHHYCKK